MNWIEADPLPKACQDCQEEECYNCDYAGARWYLSPEDEAWIRSQLAQKAAERYQKQEHASREQITGLHADTGKILGWDKEPA